MEIVLIVRGEWCRPCTTHHSPLHHSPHLTSSTAKGSSAATRSALTIPSDVPGLWTALAGRDGAEAYQAIWRLAAMPKRAATFLGEKLRSVRPVDENVIAGLVADLDSPVYQTRQRATQELSKLNRLAEPALRKTLEGRPSLERRLRVERLLEQLQGIPASELLQSLRAIEVLELVNTAEARQLLEAVAKGSPEARLRQEAKASLERLDRRRRDKP